MVMPKESKGLWNLMHQNMRVFGGGQQSRTNAYKEAFKSLRNEYGPIAVAGFTEITNNGKAVGALQEICEPMGLRLVAVVACGQTAVGKKTEYIGIGINNKIKVLSLGRILPDYDGKDFKLHHDYPNNWQSTIPTSLDYRGLVYVVVQIAETALAVSFMHNLYKFEIQRALLMQKMPAIINSIEQDPQKPKVIYVGGDFNVQPQNRPATSGNTAYFYRVAVDGDQGTTLGKNLYDYWYSNVGQTAWGPLYPPFVQPEPIADKKTMNIGTLPGYGKDADGQELTVNEEVLAAGDTGRMSDHAAILLRIM